ncbi:MAG: hypothetical protein ACJA11_002497 [Glaciecola sp.]
MEQPLPASYQGSFPVTAQHNDLVTLVHTSSNRMTRYLEKIGLVLRNMDKKVFTLQTPPPSSDN